MDDSLPPTSAIEIKAYVAVNITMAIKELPEYKDYGATDPILHDLFVSGTMTRKRFEKVSQYMHCSTAENENGCDKLAKVHPLTSLCETNFRLCFGPSQNLCVRRMIILEAVHAQENREMWFEVLASVRIGNGLLCHIQCVLRQQSGQPAGELQPWLPGCDEPDGQLPQQAQPRVRRQLVHASAFGGSPASSRHVPMWDEPWHQERLPEHSH